MHKCKGHHIAERIHYVWIIYFILFERNELVCIMNCAWLYFTFTNLSLSVFDMQFIVLL